MVYTAADASEKVTILVDVPDDLTEVTATMLNAGIDIHDDILKTDFTAGATDSTTHNDTPLGSKGQWQNFAGRNAEASITVIRDLDESGRPDPEASSEVTFAAVNTQGVPIVLAVRTGPDPDSDWTDEDEIAFIGQMSPDVPRPPTDRTSGFIKVVVPFGVQDFEAYIPVAANGG